MKKHISKVAILGSGVMGSRIACHFANIGTEVLLLDIVPKAAEGSSKPNEKNQLVNDALKAALKSSPSPIYSKSFAKRIQTGNFQDDLQKISDFDWIIEVIIEDLNIKKDLFAKVEEYRSENSIVSTNTSGIPIYMLSEGRSESFQEHFCGTHFFNPPRYLNLLELIPGPKTNPEILDFLLHYGEKFLGKKTVLCKDTPAFIANRIGVHSIMELFHLVKELDISVTDVDNITGTLIGHPKSATFRTCDVVGIDTLVRVANGVANNCKDEAIESFKIPEYVQALVNNKWLGSKTGQGFYKKTKTDGKSSILALNLNTLSYKEQKKTKFSSIEQARLANTLDDKIKALFYGKDKASELIRSSMIRTIAYSANRLPEISDEIYRLDDAVKNGFGWKHGPFELWDLLGFEKVKKLITDAKLTLPEWVEKINSKDFFFYKSDAQSLSVYDLNTETHKKIPGTETKLSLKRLKANNTLWENAEASIIDLGDGILNLEFHSKMNTIGSGIIQGINKAVSLAEESYKGLVIYNEGDNFSAGANVGLIFMLAAEQEYEELDMAIRMFQNATMRLRYSKIPVVVAPHNLTLGGATEMSLHADAVVAHAETYMGLVEFGVGLIPGGGGTKEFAVRLSEELQEGDIRTNAFRHKFLTIGQAKVSTSAEEAFELGYLRRGFDQIVINREDQLSIAKNKALSLYELGYTQPVPKQVKVFGQEAMGLVYIGANSMCSGDYISEHDKLISEKLGYVLSGGFLSEPTEVTETYLLDLERKKFMELCMERKTLERMQSLVKTGKILRN